LAIEKPDLSLFSKMLADEAKGPSTVHAYLLYLSVIRDGTFKRLNSRLSNNNSTCFIRCFVVKSYFI